MHIPDGFLSPATCAGCGLVVFPFWVAAWKGIRASADRVPAFQAGMMACFAFLVQMFNIPVPGGTTAHAVGAALIAITCGPWLAVASISVTLAVQALMFGDGGIMAYGANVLNMAVVQSITAWAVWKAVGGASREDGTISRRRRAAAAFLSGYTAIVAGAAMTGFELGIQPHLFHDVAGMAEYFPFGLGVSMSAMVLIHLLIGLVEGSFTMGAVMVLSKMPEFGQGVEKTSGGMNRVRAWMVLAAMVLLVPVGVLLPSWAGSGGAWGEWSTGDTARLARLDHVPTGMARFSDKWKAPVPDYAFSESAHPLNQSAQYMGAALLGIILTGGGLILLQKARKPGKSA